MRQTRKHFSRERGFSLIELMIVIAIIGILIGVGVPAWRLMVRRGNETAAIQTIDTIRKVQADYALGHRGEYGSFDDLIKEGALDERFAGDTPVVSGYANCSYCPRAPMELAASSSAAASCRICSTKRECSA